MDSKIEIRFEAARIAASLAGTTKEDFKDVAQNIADFIIGDAEVPEYKDKDEVMCKLVSYLESTKQPRSAEEINAELLAFAKYPFTTNLQNEQSENICGEVCPKS